MTKNEANVTFLGGAGTVTGSKFLLTYRGTRILIDCGVFQGLKALRLMNWEPLPVDAGQIDLVLLTHGHLDHVGYLPRLHEQGFSGPIYGTGPTLDIAQIILEDSGRIHEEEAKKANKEGYSAHEPALPFFTLELAQKTIDLFREVPQDAWQYAAENLHYRFVYNGHIVGSTYVEVKINDKILVFSGDIGRAHDPLLFDPKKPARADYLFLESTYGDRLHPKDDFERVLEPLIRQTIADRGALVVPSFAVERLQTLMYLLHQGFQNKTLPEIPVYVDSPMGNRVLEVFQRHPSWHKLRESDFRAILDDVTVVTSYEETWKVLHEEGPKIVIAGSGMISGGRVLTYLQQLIDQPTTRVLLVGFQAEGTRGRLLLEGAQELKIYGSYLPVRAEIHLMESLSAHGDQADLVSWMSELQQAPECVYLIHGERPAQEALAQKIVDAYAWRVAIPKLHDVVSLAV